MRIETQHLIMREFTSQDIKQAYKYLSNPKVMEYIEPVYTIEQAEEFILRYGCEKKMVYALEDKQTGQLIGHVIYHPYDTIDEYELGWILDESFWGLGYAAEISKALLEYSSSALNLVRLVAETVSKNTRSEKLIRKLGFQLSAERSGDLLKLYELELQ